MRLIILMTCLFVANYSLAQQKGSFIKPLPHPERAVNDFGKFLTKAEDSVLENELVNYWQTSSNTIVIITLSTLTDPKTKKVYTIEETALQYFNQWGIGDSIKNNGVLIMASKQPREVRIEVGRGLTDILPNEFCKSVIDQKLVPAFKQGLFFKGFKEAADTIEQKLQQKKEAQVPLPINTNDSQSPAQKKETNSGTGIFLLVS